MAVSPFHNDAGFDRVAAFYDPLSRLVFGRSLQRVQRQALACLPTGGPHVLLIGGGTGWVLPELLRLRPQAQVLYLEASPEMLRQARKTLRRQAPQHMEQVEFRLGTEAALAPQEQFDAVLTFFLLDLFAPARLHELVQRLNRARRPQAPWLVADFAPPRAWWQHALLKAMYCFFGFTTGISGRQLPDIRAALAGVGLLAGPAQSGYGGMVEAVGFYPA
ncbi:class I SAM-dependent methyltransferase [Hymenobacter lutimineralis]|uniref:Class I SAM-dependent methyltransferase n=1 Tax=Hymenobacter lutimineralis TaxID=2606448 RepID=A0A5D6UTG5_9BACT|nr:class I SAM-dependent methyltransferase [Hymenobacter lutimineralis]TYZ06407.1 class I SAM-dependent methyltransferase [Hymenobacter lutimineralis]